MGALKASQHTQVNTRAVTRRQMQAQNNVNAIIECAKSTFKIFTRAHMTYSDHIFTRTIQTLTHAQHLHGVKRDCECHPLNPVLAFFSPALLLQYRVYDREREKPEKRWLMEIK